jgi:formiminotetrahydrofolate cyclodeaminase
MFEQEQLKTFIDEVASSSPAPGGGSVAALSGSLGVALISMVCRLTIGKKKYADVQSRMEEIVKKSDELKDRFLFYMMSDTDSFNLVMKAFSLPKDTDEQKNVRQREIQDATKKATLIPLDVMKSSAEAIILASDVAEKGNKNSISDAGVAALMLVSAMEGAYLNVKINLQSVTDVEFVNRYGKEASQLAVEVRRKAENVHEIVARNLN